MRWQKIVAISLMAIPLDVPLQAAEAWRVAVIANAQSPSKKLPRLQRPSPVPLERHTADEPTTAFPTYLAPRLDLVTGATPAVKQGTLAERYCTNVADAAADARFAFQKQSLISLEVQLKKRIDELESVMAEYRSWVARRDAFSQRANDTLVRIYQRMPPEAAAQQLANMDEETAAAVLSRLDPKAASSILNDMPANHAARLSATIAGAARVEVNAAPAQGRKP